MTFRQKSDLTEIGVEVDLSAFGVIRGHLMQIDGFKERTWADWNATLSKSETKTTQDFARSAFLDSVNAETPRNVDDRRLLTSLVFFMLTAPISNLL